MGCKAPISEKEKTLCAHCRPAEGDIYSAKLREVSANKRSLGDKAGFCCTLIRFLRISRSFYMGAATACDASLVSISVGLFLVRR